MSSDVPIQYIVAHWGYGEGSVWDHLPLMPHAGSTTVMTNVL